jgi:hypothetical protein
MMTSDNLPWYIERGRGPLLAAAIHDGHEVRGEVADNLALSESNRLREEDPCTGNWTAVAPTRLVALQSRFEVDFNRPREKAVYLSAEDAWGLEVWKTPPTAECVERSLAVHDAFYAEVKGLLERMVGRYGRVLVLDLHTYNHRREGPAGPMADPGENPEVNVGTGTMDRKYWASIVDRFIVDLRDFDFLGRRLDVRENVKFRGGYFPAWAHRTFPKSVCVISVEFKKLFMDEWTGEVDATRAAAVERALKSTVWGIHEELVGLGQPDCNY